MQNDRNDVPRSADVFTAAQHIASYIHRTPLISSRLLNTLSGANLWFKCEHLQKVGAFKARGVCNALAQVPSEVTMVATHSSGNHGAALAWAAAERGLACTVVMPETAPQVKRAAVAAYGAEIVICGPSQADRERALESVVAQTGAHVVPPFDDRRIIAGQGTVALETIQQCRERGFTPDVLVAPVGGGGLLAGVGLAVAALAPDITVMGAEPAGADDAQRSLRGGVHITAPQVPDTIADGLRTSLGRRNYAVIRRTVRDIVTVTEHGIVEAMRMLWMYTKQLVEPSAAVGLAAVLEHSARFRNKNVALILTGGNMDLDRVADLFSREELS
ncbi:threonine ammonia-lyase [Microbulbifer thermotolerans]|uniref:Pyridoxal-phosphate dependent enzyme n=1 Tax=Microbulbifer thermotolerans TaxID=252514 RepID=A0A143HMS0_MICTH|nr:pyridoxal-phosphate dependent enzyme [Microbulbifer thermotolerans]AMX03025.1 serine dehydratase [Microbulbifer thermotolerans]MCX2778982.1 pyridoxal-phosphate dependent enzyme [Microbulbifer thermotolerans]MCX2781507.1 pyridoxal-phosphate dependent enzyme [Microbulbifer thermotolerans]MCX2795746.1 pyridoxal-phosphate dependent enzyme [Microbulbifer thermotolerans]MCX2802012.1 pyridoxal-phosphate dependent enzyme [Microbulbifer thermotolerans]